ncbi:unnamed protein product [Darwinula stevensoni]|uniref:UDENN domain-containing protein n=1 Tax=Darwinula stevensoni TaxID=69355 RepID=A0A7R9ACX7_9CRUS|nr:unnamed protein product [Darwinula stevensoni]CAG0900754.1 unnamed protein product [Darwinula stevensoni]
MSECETGQDNAPIKEGFRSDGKVTLPQEPIDIESLLRNEGPILHVLIVVFHHKKGAVVEYAYPALQEDDPTELPEPWKQLPSLAIPDGAHKYEWDTVYFHLPSISLSQRTVFGISCYRQINAKDVKNPSRDITRTTVQKAICVLSSLPLYGHIRVHVWEVAEHYMKGGDLSNTEELPRLYKNLNASLNEGLLSSKELYLGLELRDLVLHFRHKVLVLFKLLLLERKVLFIHSPVHTLCSGILALVSLVPLMLQKGLNHAACVRSKDTHVLGDTRNLAEKCSPGDPKPSFVIGQDGDEVSAVKSQLSAEEELLAEIEDALTPEEEKHTHTTKIQAEKKDHEGMKRPSSSSSLKGRLSGMIGGNWVQRSPSEEKLQPPSPVKEPKELGEKNGVNFSVPRMNIKALDNLDLASAGFPLTIFSQGMVCHPYLALPYIDVLGDVNLRGYWVGASNDLFKHKKHLADVLVQLEDARVEVYDPELRRQLSLTTEDLRFADFIVKSVSEEASIPLEMEEWIRLHFWLYALHLAHGSREMEFYNAHFVSAWKETHNYRLWVGRPHDGILEINPGHPFSGQLSVSDVKLKLSHTLQSSERGRRINQTLSQTGKVVGGALSNAKGALSSWWNNISLGHEPPSPHMTGGVEEAHEVVGEEDDMVIIGVCNNDTTKISSPKKAKS